MTFTSEPVEVRFWRFVEKTDTCWLWTGNRVGQRRWYGGFWDGKQLTRAHRFSFVLHGGVLTSGQVVMHTCDNGLCVNPDHLCAGTQPENIADMVSKNRQSRLKGGDNPRAKLTTADVARIRELRSQGVFCSEIAKEFYLSKSQVSAIATGRSWGDL